MDAAAEQKSDASENQNGNIPSADNTDNIQDGSHSQNSDCKDNGQPKNGKKGFKFERLKEEIANASGDTSAERDNSVIISNPAFRDDNNIQFPANQEVRGSVRQADNCMPFLNDQNYILESGKVNVCFENEDVPKQRASNIRSSTVEEPVQNKMPDNQEVIDDEQHVDSDER